MMISLGIALTVTDTGITDGGTGDFTLVDVTPTSATSGLDVVQGYAWKAINVDQNANMAAGSGAVHIDNTGNTGAAFYVYTDKDSGQSRELAMFRADNVGFDTDVIQIENDGTGDSLEIDQNGDGISINIDSLSSTKPNIQINNAQVTTGGVLEIVNNGNQTASDGSGRSGVLFVHQANADSTKPILHLKTGSTGQGILLDHNGEGTAIYIDAEASSADVLDIRANGDNDAIYIDQNGANGRGIQIDSEGSVGPILIRGNATAQTCNGAQEGSLYYDAGSNKFYGCDGSSWNAFY